MAEPDDRLLREIPLYSIADAARFTGARPVDVRRWVEGYPSRDNFQGPVSEPALRLKTGFLYLTFHHLIEVWAIRRMRYPENGAKGLSLQQIRKAADAARVMFQTDFPLADERLRWDGVGIFYEALGDAVVEGGLIELSRRTGQATWSGFVAAGLQKIEYKDQQAVRLWPLGQNHAVVLDPTLNDGWPTVTRGKKLSGIPADVVAEMVQAGDSIEGVASAYRIGRSAVVDAMDFVATWTKVAA